MTAHEGIPVLRWWEESYDCHERWNLEGATRGGREGQISIGVFPSGAWCVDHSGFGWREFDSKDHAINMLEHLKTLHDGRWVKAPADSKRISPFLLNGMRILQSEVGPDVYSNLGIKQAERWSLYKRAVREGTKVRKTVEHPDIGGYIELRRFVDPYTKQERYLLDDSHDTMPTEWVDYPDRKSAISAYFTEVNRQVSRRFPFLESDVPNVPVSSSPRRARRVGGGIVLIGDDVDC